MENSSIQKIFKAILPQSMYEDMEKESRMWMMQCEKCKFEKSVWETGGIRWKAAGNPRVYRICPNCKKRVGFGFILRR